MGPKGSATDDSWGAFTQSFEAVQLNNTTRSRIGSIWPLLELTGDKNAMHTKVIREWLDPIVQVAVDDYKRAKLAGVSNYLSDKTFLQHLVENTEGKLPVSDVRM